MSVEPTRKATGEGRRADDRGHEGVSAPVHVDIYIAEGCFSCVYSREVAAAIRSNFPEIQVRLIDIGDPKTRIPEAVFATPTYLLDGQVWSLGNPSPQDVQERLSAALIRRG